MSVFQLQTLLSDPCAIAIEAGRIALELRDGRSETKVDGSPVTAADEAADAYITAALRELGDTRIVSEETFDGSNVPSGEPFWLVDPLDGTKEFLKPSGEFTVNIALIEDGRPVLGVVHAPALGVTYYAAEGQGAFRRDADGSEVRIGVAPLASPLRMAVSRDHIGSGERELIARLGDVTVAPMGSSLKFCLVAEGRADLYPRYGATKEWDTAAAQCVVECAGGSVLALDSGEPLRYAKRELLNPSFVAVGDAAAARLVLGDA
ncbi:MAG TPA: 3'(2'),5'-bisphosphate nucleotidase CysQ [Thermoanaerobaculia bacterium]|jgi:3'(2'), 5'-bisphosphate nucleotidase